MGSYHTSTSPSPEDLQGQQRRATLYRVLASNMIRELRENGIEGNELLGLATAVMEAISEDWNQPQPRKVAHTDQPRRKSKPRYFHKEQIIVGERVLLRRIKSDDRPLLGLWSRDPLVQRSLIPADLPDIFVNIAGHGENDPLDMIICERAERVPIGLVCLRNIDRSVLQAELWKLVGEPSYRRRGYAEEAARLIVEHGFDNLGLNRIYLRTLGGNLTNIRLNERLGFRFEGVLKQAASSNAELVDVVIMAALRESFRFQSEARAEDKESAQDRATSSEKSDVAPKQVIKKSA